MTNKPQGSVRRFLLISIIASLLSISLISGAISWLNTQEELDELYDQNMKEIAKVIDAQHAVMTSEYVTPKSETPIKGEEYYFVRIRDVKGKTLYTSHPSIDLEKPDHEGFSKFFYHNKQWKVFTQKSESANDYIDIAQIHHYRILTIGEIAYSLLIPQLISIPLLGLLIWLIIGKGLKPLEALSSTIANRNEALLTPVSLEKAPVEIQPIVLSLNDLLERLENMMKVLRQFTADAAHELRTPLTALTLQLAVLEKADNETEREQAIKQLKAGVERSVSLVQQLLTLAREEPSIAVDFAPVHLSDIVKESITTFMPSANSKRIDLGLVKTSDALIQANANSIEILINNLIDNAIRYTPEDGIIDISIDETSTHITLEVADTGPGIPAIEHDKIFNRFYRGKGITSPGTGLGLAIVKEIADRHGLKTELGMSEELKGLSFKIVFEK